MEKKRYGGLDGLRTVACIGIVMMHVRANNSYAISGFIYNNLISSFTDFVFLFMAVSAFGMCCGYYSRMLTGQINLTDFYKKRYIKILPFFSLLVLLDLAMEFSREALCEAVADLSLTFGLFPNNISVIGVGWFLGLVFAFYLIFPFFCVLIETKKRAWMAFAASLIMNFLCAAYFEIGRTNIVYSLCFFLLGGLIYLYREKLETLKWYVTVPVLAASVLAYFIIGRNTFTCLFVSAAMLIFALGRSGGGMVGKVTNFFSSVSMEVYLSHMVIFRAVEKAGLNRVIANDTVQYLVTVVMVLAGSVVFSAAVKQVFLIIEKKIIMRKTRQALKDG